MAEDVQVNLTTEEVTIQAATPEDVQVVTYEETVEVEIPNSTQGPPGPPGTPGDGAFYDQSVTPSDGQTQIILDSVPTNNASIFLIVNGVTYLPGAGFIISGVTLTLVADWSLTVSDTVVVRYTTS